MEDDTQKKQNLESEDIGHPMDTREYILNHKFRKFYYLHLKI